MSKEDLIPTKYYWVKTGEYKDPLPFYFSKDGFRVDIVGRTNFITPYALGLIFGKDCILREVDFVNDLIENSEVESPLDVIPFAIEEDGKIQEQIMFGNAQSVLYANMLIPTTSFPVGKYIKFKKD